MAELPDNVMIYGFAFIDELSELDIDEIHENLMAKGHVVSDVIFSTWDDADSNCTWVIAADRYMEEDEVEAALNFITENDLQQEYCLMDFLYGRM